jgi:hypothetical protein
LPETGALPSEFAPSLKVIVPVAVPPSCGITVAVKVTSCPNVEGLADEVTDVDVVSICPDGAKTRKLRLLARVELFANVTVTGPVDAPGGTIPVK